MRGWCRNLFTRACEPPSLLTQSGRNSPTWSGLWSDKVSKPTLTCNVPGCGLPCEYVSMDCEEVLVMHGEDSSTERLFPGRVARNHHVRCSEHGIRTIQVFGNHISVQPRPSTTSERRRKNRKQRSSGLGESNGDSDRYYRNSV